MADQCRIYLYEFDRERLIPIGPPRDCGRGPIDDLKLKTGQYRLTAVRESDGTICEFNLVLTGTGEAARRTIHLLGDGESFPPQAAPAELPSVGRHMAGFLRPPITDGMVRIESGVYDLHADTNAGTALATAVTLGAFYVDSRKVSNREYAEFIAATGFRRPNFWKDEDPATILDLPVMGISLEEAEAYARWRGKRLPTLHEWQAAARGPQGLKYPTGNLPPESVEPPDALRREAGTADGDQQRRLYIEHALRVDAADGLSPPGGPAQTFASMRELTGTVSLVNLAAFQCGRAWFETARDRTLGEVNQSPYQLPSPHAGFRCVATVRE